MAHLKKLCALLVYLANLAAACTAVSTSTPAIATDSSLPSRLQASATSPPLKPSLTPLPPSSATQVPGPTGTLTPTAPAFRVCSPLQGFAAADLPDAAVNPYHPPPLGSDDPHQGIDLAQVQNGIALSGLPVQATLEGRVALVVSERFPYGNALLIETPLDSLPPTWQELLDLPSIPATPQVRSQF